MAAITGPEHYAIAKRMRSTADRAVVLPLDSTDAQAVRAAVDRAVESFSRIDAFRALAEAELDSGDDGLEPEQQPLR